LIETAFMGVFSTTNGLVFYIFWELALIPAYFISALWGGADRIRITFKFFIYTFTGSLFMLVALIYLYYRTPAPHSFDVEFLYSAILSPEARIWVSLAFFAAFAVKVPIFPFHTWQPDTYTVSPTAGTMVLSGIMLKMGLYGLIRFLLPIGTSAVLSYGKAGMILAITGIVYASVIAIRQSDLKRFFAYVSLAHVGLIAAGILSVTMMGMEGAIIQMVSHGINITGLFIILGFIERRVKTREINSLGGMAASAPWLAVCFMIILLANIALPLTNGFVGEFLLLLGIFEYSKIMAAVAGLTVILSAVYMLRMYQRVMLGEPNDLTRGVADLDRVEILTLVPLIILILWIGLFPQMFIHIAAPSVYEIYSIIK
jgi:NADH-quinone oxidoreductase subunit M